MSVNTMASNLTSQVRGFAQISAAATDGDFTRFITVEASGEMDSLKTQINQMVYNLRESIQKNTAAREAAELANRSKSEFLANMSHEIRYVGRASEELGLIIDRQNTYERNYRNDRSNVRDRGFDKIPEGESYACSLSCAVLIAHHRRYPRYL